jgi:hypothetical protein
MALRKGRCESSVKALQRTAERTDEKVAQHEATAGLNRHISNDFNVHWPRKAAATLYSQPA